MSDDIFTRRAQLKESVTEIETRKQEHLRRIEEKENELRERLSFSNSQSEERRAELFFETGGAQAQDIESLEAAIRKLEQQTRLFDVEIARRRRVVDALEGEYRDAVFAKYKSFDNENKQQMAEHLIGLAKCFAAEIEMVDEIQRADTTPPPCFRVMRPGFVGRLDDPNSFVASWLRELKSYYPRVKV
jgi:hypothetical protein